MEISTIAIMGVTASVLLLKLGVLAYGVSLIAQSFRKPSRFQI